MEAHDDFDFEQVDRDLDDIRADSPSDYRLAAERFVRILHAAIEWQVDSPQKWAVLFATAHLDCAGRSMADVAAQLGVSRALISGLATRFCREHGLPPSTYMRSEEAAALARKIRRAYVEKHKNNGNGKRK